MELRRHAGHARGRLADGPARRDGPKSLSTDLAAAGFCALEVDRAGLTDPAPVVSALTGALGAPLSTSSDGRLVAFDLRPLRASLVASAGSDDVQEWGWAVLHRLSNEVMTVTEPVPPADGDADRPGRPAPSRLASVWAPLTVVALVPLLPPPERQPPDRRPRHLLAHQGRRLPTLDSGRSPARTRGRRSRPTPGCCTSGCPSWLSRWPTSRRGSVGSPGSGTWDGARRPGPVRLRPVARTAGPGGHRDGPRPAGGGGQPDPRPQLVSIALAAVVTAAWLCSARDLRARWWLVPVTWVWACSHGLWFVGPLVGLARRGRSGPRREPARGGSTARPRAGPVRRGRRPDARWPRPVAGPALGLGLHPLRQ